MMQIVHFTCDRCYRTDIEDDALGWKQTKDGRDLCPACQFPFPSMPEVSFDAQALAQTVGTDRENHTP